MAKILGNKLVVVSTAILGLSLIFLLAACLEVISVGVELRISKEAVTLLIGNETHCALSLQNLSEKTKQELESLKEENEEMVARTVVLKQMIAAGRAKVSREREEMREAEKQNRAAQEEIKGTLVEMEIVNKKIKEIKDLTKLEERIAKSRDPGPKDQLKVEFDTIKKLGSDKTKESV